VDAEAWGIEEIVVRSENWNQVGSLEIGGQVVQLILTIVGVKTQILVGPLTLHTMVHIQVLRVGGQGIELILSEMVNIQVLDLMVLRIGLVGERKENHMLRVKIVSFF
jgi:hypothetical protein